MGAAAASVLLVAILLQRRDRVALLLAALTLSYVLWGVGRGAHAIGYEWGPTLASVSLCWIGVSGGNAYLVARALHEPN